MDDIGHWLVLAADVLGEPDPETADDLLADGLRRWGHAYLTVRTATPPEPLREKVSLHPPTPWEQTPVWVEAVEAALDHPLYAYNAHTRTARPATLAGVMAEGWVLSEQAAFLMEELDFTRHQMTIPLAHREGPLAHREGEGRDHYGLVSEDPYTEDDLERAAAIQSLLAGLDGHVRLLQQAHRSGQCAPDPVAVPLTPRERVVLDLIARGHTVEGMAARLSISPRTVHKHQEHLYRKLGAVDRLSAVLSAQRLGLVRSPDH